MTGYTPEELASGSEFKILRSATSAFRRPEFLRQVLDEEKEAGWTLVEKIRQLAHPPQAVCVGAN